MLPAKSKLSSVKVLISKTLTDLNISHDEFVLINNVLKELYYTKDEIQNSNGKQTVYKAMLSSCLKCRKKYRKYKSKNCKK